MRPLRRRGFLKPGQQISGNWTWSRNGERTGSIGFTIDLTDPVGGIARLDYAVNGEARLRTIEIEAAPCRYGGFRYYFRCPQSGRRCEILCCVGGEFAARQHHRLTYFSQSETSLDRLARASRKAEEKLRAENGRPKLRGANRERLFDRFIKLESAWTEAFDAEAMRRFGHLF